MTLEEDMHLVIDSTGVERKWEVAARLLKRDKETELYELAKTIDESMVKHYGKHVHTRAWIDYYNEFIRDKESTIGVNLITDFYSNPSLCTACSVHKLYDNATKSCEVCKFGKEHGQCGWAADSKYHVFSDLIWDVWCKTSKYPEECP